ncbi:MAG TPA: TIM-barrel domain-containing protein, partial [Dongiaceae bacterium]|nr:TIM-barrel domain-containing protein [Dongiaceae bacterium]
VCCIQPVIWMQQTDGHNTLTLGLLDQVSVTGFEGSTYDPANGGEAPGIANSYVRVALNRAWPSGAPALVFKDAIYINADPHLTWFEALEGYSAAVDAARGFKARPVSQWALNPMWHSWYAHADKIDEAQIRDDARRAGALGATTIEIDAGWNMPRAAGYSFDNEGDYDFDSGRFPNAKGMIEAMHAAGQRVVLHAAPLVMGKNSRSWAHMKDCLIRVGGKADAHLDPRLEQVHDYLLASWERLFTHYGIDGLWCDFLEIPARADPPAAGAQVVSPDLHLAYTQLMQALYHRSLALNSNAVIVLRRPSANLNAKTFCTHVWPMDTPQDYNMNRRDIVYMKTFGPGALTHACCTSWAISESDVNVARQMASIVLAGVPAFSVKLAESPAAHNAIVKAWLAFYERNKRDLVLGRMTPLLPTPPSAGLRIEGEEQAFFGFFEAVPGLIEVTKPVNKVTLVNGFNARTATRLEGVTGEWRAQVYDQVWQPSYQTMLKTDERGGLNINCAGPNECHAIVLTKR